MSHPERTGPRVALPSAVPTRASVAVAALAALTSYLTLRSWTGISQDPATYLGPLLGLALLVAVVSVAARALRASPGVMAAVQLLTVVLFLNHRWAASDSLAGWVPTLASLRASALVLLDAGIAAQEFRAPVPASATAFPPLLVGVGALVILLVALLGDTLRQVPLAGLPLIAAFTLPTSLLGGVPTVTFALAALSYAFLLMADQAVRLDTWDGTPAAPVPDTPGAPPARPLGPGGLLPGLVPPAARIAAAGVFLAVLAPLVLPAGLGLLDGTGGGGAGGSGGPLRLSNPMLNLQRDLVRGEDVPLVLLRTDDPNPSYLRLTVLDEFDGQAWRPSTRDIPPNNQADESLPTPPGLSDETRRVEVRSQLEAIGDFESQWLPTPYPPVDVSVVGDWRYDSETLDIVGSDVRFTSAQVTSLRVQPTAEQLVDAIGPPAAVDSAGTELPEDMPEFVQQLAEEVTAGAVTDFERVVLLQRWFRRDGGFEYSLDRASGNGLDQLELFLGTGPGSRVGYCEQFAASLALMARTLGIPARVAVGFLTPERSTGDERWVYSRHDLHAWPEVYFQGAGWIRFEPTPQDRVVSIPEYTAGSLPGVDEEVAPAEEPSLAPEETPRELRRDDALAPSETDAQTSGPWLTLVLALVAAAGAVVAPRVLRDVARRRRLRGGDPVTVVEGAWAEVRATCLDLGLPWDDAATLRQQAVALVPALRRAGSLEAPVADDAVATLESLVRDLERSRYSRDGIDAAAASAAAEAADKVCAALVAHAPSGAQRRAGWLPPSLWRARSFHLGEVSRNAASLSDRDQVLL